MANVTITGAGPHSSAAATDKIPASKAGVKGYLTPLQIADYIANTGTTLTSEGAMDLIASFLVAGTNISLSYNDVANTLTISSSSSVADGDKGDIIVSSSGGVWTIDNGSVTLAKMADMATGSLFYRKTAGAGAPEVQTLATLKTDLGLTGTNSGDQTITLTGDVTGSGTGSFAATIANDAVTTAKIINDAVTFAKIQNVTANSVVARAAGTDGDVSAVSLAASQLLGRGSTGDITAISLGAGLSMSGATLSASGGGGSLPRSYLAGFRLANNATDATNDIDIAPGACRDSTNTTDITLASALTKRLDAAWAVGSGNGGLDQGSIANATYHVHAIRRSDTGVVDAIFSLSHDRSATCTMTIASPAVVTMGSTGRGHGLVAGSPIKFSTTGALPTGVTAGTQYYVISTGLTETQFQFSTSNGGSAVNTSGSQSGTHTCLPGPQMPTGYDSFRRIGSIVRASAAIRAFTQDGDYFAWSIPTQDVSASISTTASTRTLTLPVGLPIRAIVTLAINVGPSNSTYSYMSSLSSADTAASASCFSVWAISAAEVTWDGTGNSQVVVLTDAAARVRIRNSANATTTVVTLAWIDTRGRDD